MDESGPFVRWEVQISYDIIHRFEVRFTLAVYICRSPYLIFVPGQCRFNSAEQILRSSYKSFNDSI